MIARIADVSIGTVRTISIIQGRTRLAFFLAFLESGLWLSVTSAIFPKVVQQPLLGFFYALGFALGNVAGVSLEKKLAIGHSVLRIISKEKAEELVQAIRAAGYAATTFKGEGRQGDVTLIYAIVKRRELPEITRLIGKIEKDAFYIFETAGNMSREIASHRFEPTGWRAIFKKK